MVTKVQANEVHYDLQSLGWKAFQNLCSTIVSEIWGQTIQIFFDANDGGRDGAFNGNWERTQSELYTGTFAVQCKHTTKYESVLKLSDLREEIEKAKRLASRGLADNYFLFSNAKLTGKNDEIISSEFERIPSLKKCTIFGSERISQIIRESKRLRMLVPRVYGLGDLSQILDERAYDQAREILSSLGEDLNKFIVTDAYRQSVKALVDHGFVLLLGEPMCGKSTIAAALSMVALDEWGCSTIKVRDAEDFVKHRNPNEKQLFWVDDAFGSTQIDWTSALNWSRTFPHVNAAIHKGAKVIFTSRDYVFKSARKYLKESALPVLQESQVVIQVENLTKEEREQILYNHIRLGNQKKEYRKKIKNFLPQVAANSKFSPEIARRLGNSFFTKELAISAYDLNKFIQEPLSMLCEIIGTLDDANRSALTLVFMRGGNLLSPPVTTLEEDNALSRIGGGIGDAVKGLEALSDSLLINTVREGEYFWNFKHPTVRDAFAKVVASSPNLMDIYLTGAPIEKLFTEISCGDVGVKGVSVIVPATQYGIVLKKIKAFDTSKWFNKLALNRFLAHRCDKIFLESFLGEHPEFVARLSITSQIYVCSDLDVLLALYKFNLINEAVRLLAISEIKRLALSTPDSGYLREDIKFLMSQSEFLDILQTVKNNLFPNLSGLIDELKSDFNGEDEPSSYFEELRSAIVDYQYELDDCEESQLILGNALVEIDSAISDLEAEYSPVPEEDLWMNDAKSDSNDAHARSVFDDIDK